MRQVQSPYRSQRRGLGVISELMRLFSLVGRCQSERHQPSEPVPQDDRVQSQVPKQRSSPGVCRNGTWFAFTDQRECRSKGSEMGRAEGTIMNPVQKLPRHSLVSVQCSQPAANNRPDGISVASGANRFREGKQRIVTVSQEDERGERQGVDDEP